MDDQTFFEIAAKDQIDRAPEYRGKIKMTDGVIPLFHYRPVEDKLKSKEEGRPMFRDVAYIYIQVPGSKDKFIAPVNEQHKRRFPEQWESFEKGEPHDDIVGTPVTEWQGISRTRAHELKAAGFYTVEMIAQCADARLKALGGQPNALRLQAQQFIAGTDALAQQRAENQLLNDKIANLETQLQELLREQSQDDPAKRGRGRRNRHPG